MGGIRAAWDVLTAARAERARDEVQTPAIQNATPLSGITSQSGEVWTAFTGIVGGGDAGVNVSAQTAANVTAVQACVQLISGAIAGLPMNTYERSRDGERRQIYNEDLWWILNEEFNPRWMAATGWSYMGHSLLLHGDAFAEIERRGSQVVGIRPMHPRNVEVKASPDGRRLIYIESRDVIDGADVAGRQVYDQDDVLHVPGFGFDGLRSVSPLRSHLRASVGTALAMQEYQSRFFKQGARPDYVLKTQNQLNADGLAALRAQVDEYHGGVGKSRRPMLLGGGIELQTISLPLEDVELLGLRHFAVEEIARAFGVQPWMIGREQKMALGGSGIGEIGTMFVRYTLLPYLTSFQNEFNRKLYRRGGKFLEFDTSELEKADFKSMVESFRVALGRAGEPGMMTQPEVRRRLNMPATPTEGTLATGMESTTDAE